MLLEQAFTCPSALQLKKSKLKESYQRLEFLGDCILKTVITELIFKIYPSFNEGQLSKRREELEKNKALSIISEKMGLIELAIKSPNEKINYKLQADLIESIIGAIMVDSNFDYKLTRYHTLLLIRENVERDIDFDLFFDYVEFCKSEIKTEKITNEEEEKTNSLKEKEKEITFKKEDTQDIKFNQIKINKSLKIHSPKKISLNKLFSSSNELKNVGFNSNFLKIIVNQKKKKK